MTQNCYIYLNLHSDPKTFSVQSNGLVQKNTVAGKAAKAKEKELEEWLRGLDGMDRLVDDYVGDKIPLWEKIMDRQGTVCCAWEKTAFEEGLKVGIRLMMEVYSL